MKRTLKHISLLATGLAFLAAFGFFQFAYPYHLVRREQMNLFLFDWDYIRQTYRGVGWLGRLAGDFLEQFLHLPVAGPLVVALLLTALGAVVYRICRKFLGQGPALAVAAAFFVWSFLRETGNHFLTRYTVVTLAYLSLVLAALQLRKAGLRPLFAVLLVAVFAWPLGAPIHKYYGKAWGVPRLNYERIIGLDAEVAREHWDKVLRMSDKDLYMVEASYCYNLAHAMKGDLGKVLFNHSQSTADKFLLQVSSEQSVFTNSLAGEAWFQLGDMTIAEQSAITSLQASPKHTGVRYILRLARVNLISGEDAVAQKYLNLLSKTLFYGKWARRMMPGNQDEKTRADLAEARSRLATRDFVHHSDLPRQVLLGLLEANPDNEPARDFLLCLDLMCYDLDAFMEDLSLRIKTDRIYQEAVLIWLSQQDRLTEQECGRYGISGSMVSRMERFFRNPDNYKNTYWYYYLNALYEEDQKQ